MQTLSKDHHQVTVNALANMVRLLAAELVAGHHRDDMDLLEQAMRAKLANIDRTPFTPEAFDKGLAQSRQVIEHVLAHVRAQAARTQAETRAQTPVKAQAATSAPKRRAPNRPKVPTQH
ncbi:hypothetical protein [Chelatococcus reniformis]|nr:hypothetical protein [Chelatococcus reniformis]